MDFPSELAAKLDPPTKPLTTAVDLDWARETAQRLLTQDNRFTAHPVFLVQERKRDYGYDPDWSDQIAWIRIDEGEVDEEEAEALEAQWRSTGREPDDFYRTAYRDRWEYVATFLTEKAADRFIEANQHRFRELRTYVDSAHRNLEWQQLRAVISRLGGVTLPEHRGARRQCSGCGYVTNEPVGRCKGYCQDPTGNSCDAVPCPRCGAIHYWTGSINEGRAQAAEAAARG